LEWKLVRFFSHKKIREKVLGMEACEIFFPPKNLGRRFLEWKLMRFFPTKNLGRRLLEWKLVRFFSHKKT